MRNENFYNIFHDESLKNLIELCELKEDLKEKLIASIPKMGLKERGKLLFLLGQYYIEKLKKEEK